MAYFDDAQTLFEARHEEVRSFLFKFKSLVNNDSNLDRCDEHILKSNILLMQYNILESSFLELYKSFYLFLQSCHISIDNINKSFAYNLYLIMRRGSQKKIDKFKLKLSDSSQTTNFSKSAMFASFDLDEEEKKFLVNGNLDGRKIKKFLEDFGIDTALIESIELSSLQIIKDKRQLLAHGGASFSDVGKDISWDALENNVETLKQIFDATKVTLISFCNSLNNSNAG